MKRTYTVEEMEKCFEAGGICFNRAILKEEGIDPDTYNEPTCLRIDSFEDYMKLNDKFKSINKSLNNDQGKMYSKEEVIERCRILFESLDSLDNPLSFDKWIEENL